MKTTRYIILLGLVSQLAFAACSQDEPFEVKNQP